MVTYFSNQRARAERQELELQIELLNMRIANASSEHYSSLPLPIKALQFRDIQLSGLSSNQRALVTALNEIGRYSIRRADYDKALEELNESLRVTPTTEALYYKGVALYGKRAFPLAVEPWKQALSMDLPQETKKQVALNLALAYYEKNDPAQAMYYFEHGVLTNSK